MVTWFEFASDNDDTLEVYLGISATSMAGALKNLETETAPYRTAGKNLYPHRLFDALLKQAESAWEKRLSIAEANGGNDAKAMFYTSLYHVMINPSLYQDVDGKYRGIDHETHQAEGFTNYTVFSVWGFRHRVKALRRQPEPAQKQAEPHHQNGKNAFLRLVPHCLSYI